MERASNAEEELVFLERLENVVVGAAANGFEGGGDVVNGCDHDHRDFGVVFTEPVEELNTVHFGHDHVAEDKIGRGPCDLLLSSAAIANGGAAIALGFEHGGNDFSNRFFIVNNEDLF